MGKAVFLSMVTSEFEHEFSKTRTELARVLIRFNVVAIRYQETFFQHGVPTLQMLAEKIEKSDIVVHLIGNKDGWYPPNDQVERFIERHPRFKEHFSNIARRARENKISATQWEAWLALYFGKRLVCFSLNGQPITNSVQLQHQASLQEYGYFTIAVDPMDLKVEVLGCLMELGWFSESPTNEPLQVQIKRLLESFSRISAAGRDLGYQFRQGSSIEMIENKITTLRRQFECVEVEYSDKYSSPVAHICYGTRAGFEEFSQLALQALKFVPHDVIAEIVLAKNPLFQWCQAIIMIEHYIGSGKLGMAGLFATARQLDTGEITPSFYSDDITRKPFENAPVWTEKLTTALSERRLKLIDGTRTLRLDKCGEASIQGINLLLGVLDLPPYAVKLKPSFENMIRLIWDIEDMTAGFENLGLLEDQTVIPLPASENSVQKNLFHIMCGVDVRVGNFTNSWEHFTPGVVGWDAFVEHALHALPSVMAERDRIFGWTNDSSRSLPNEVEQLPKIPMSLDSHLRRIVQKLRAGLPKVKQDAAQLGTLADQLAVQAIKTR